MVSEEVTTKNLSGLHLRPAGILCNKTTMFQSLVISKSGINPVTNAKSAFNVLEACVKRGNETEFIYEGDNEVEALAAMVGAVRDDLGEQDFQKPIIG